MFNLNVFDINEFENNDPLLIYTFESDNNSISISKENEYFQDFENVHKVIENKINPNEKQDISYIKTKPKTNEINDTNNQNYLDLISSNNVNDDDDLISENDRYIYSPNKNQKSNKPKELIFDIKHIKKKGRIPKNAKNFKGNHDKKSLDNIIRKIKAGFYRNIVDYVNYIYEESSKNKCPNKKINQKFIQKIDSSESKKIKKEDNLKWFSLKLKEMLSAKISSKCTNYKSDYNKKQIEKIYKKNELKELIEILEKEVRDIYKMYCNDTEIKGFKTLKNEIDNLRRDMEKNKEDINFDEYLEKYKESALNLEEIFANKRDRRTD